MKHMCTLHPVHSRIHNQRRNLVPTLATSLNIVRAGITGFRDEVRRNPQLRSRLAHARAWYAHQDEDGQWLFGPSKFVGYKGLTAEQYIEQADKGFLDGRRTEIQLKQWFEQLDPGTELHEQLRLALSDFLAEHNKAPNQKMRINIPREDHTDSQSGAGTPLLDLIVAVAESLQSSELQALRRRLTAIS